MTFEKQFPSLKPIGKVNWDDKITMNSIKELLEDIQKNCLDKQLVRKAINELSVWPAGYNVMEDHMIRPSELKKRLGL